MKTISVERYMTKSPVVIKASESLEKAWELLEKEPFTHLPVIDEKGIVSGMLSSTDIANFQKLFSHMQKNYDTIKLNLTVEGVMSNPVQVISPDESIQDANDRMLAKKIKALPVVKDNAVIGIITESDILRYYNDTYRS
ncbi:MAG: CBS domain-containing protein [Leptospirales bacterium]